MSTEADAAALPATQLNEKNPVLEGEQDVGALGNQDHERRPACFKSTFQEIVFVLTVTMGIAMGAFTSGSVTVISSFVGRDLGMTTAEITWISSASTLAGGAFLLFFGKVADLFGRKSLFVGSLFLFAVFSLAAGFAKTPISLDVLNGVMGLMTASAVPPAQGIMGVIYEKPSKRKNKAFACYGAGNPLGFVFGTIFSGIATNLFSWRASYYLLAMIYLVFTIIAVFTVPKDFTAKEPLALETVKKFDILGTVLTIAGIGMLSAALSLGDTAPQGWKTGYVLALLIVGALLIIGFVIWENFCKYPLVPMSIWKDRDFSICMALLFLGNMAFSVSAFFASLYFQNIWHYSALKVAVHLLPMAIMGICVNIFAGLVLHRISNKLLMLVGTLGYTGAFLLFAVNRRNDSYWAFFFPGFVLMVVGADLQFNVANMYVVSSLPPEQQSIAGGIFQTVTKLCQTIGYGITTAIFNSVSQNPDMGGYYKNYRETQPYSAVFWFATAASVFGLLLVPFLKIGTQGGSKKKVDQS